MARIILICGKICSGKTTLAKSLLQQSPAVLLSTDEATFDLTANEQGEFYNVFAGRVNRYLRKKAVEIVRAGADVILDWGFWTAEERREMSAFLTGQGVEFEWHYLDVSDELWRRSIEQRNRAVAAGEGGSDFFVDEGLLQKLLSRFEVPAKEEMDVWHTRTDTGLNARKEEGFI